MYWKDKTFTCFPFFSLFSTTNATYDAARALSFFYQATFDSFVHFIIMCPYELDFFDLGETLVYEMISKSLLVIVYLTTKSLLWKHTLMLALLSRFVLTNSINFTLTVTEMIYVVLVSFSLLVFRLIFLFLFFSTVRGSISLFMFACVSCEPVRKSFHKRENLYLTAL